MPRRDVTPHAERRLKKRVVIKEDGRYLILYEKV